MAKKLMIMMINRYFFETSCLRLLKIIVSDQARVVNIVESKQRSRKYISIPQNYKLKLNELLPINSHFLIC